MSKATREARDRMLFDRVATHYARKDLLPSSATARRQQLMWALQPVLKGRSGLGTVVDIGCGIGATAHYLAGYYSCYVGIDHSSAMITAARDFNRGNNQARFINQNVKNIRLLDGVADLILSIGALHHMTELDAVMASLAQIARPGAFLVVIEPHNGNPLIQALRHIRGAVDASYSVEQTQFTGNELIGLFERHGLLDIIIDHHGYLSPAFAQVILRPQALFAPLCRIALQFDSWLHRSLPPALRSLSFNATVVGRFPG